MQEGGTGLGRVGRRSRLPFAGILVGLVYSPFTVNFSVWVCLYKSLKNLAACVYFEVIIYLFKEVLSNELDFSNSGLLNFLRIESKWYFPLITMSYCMSVAHVGFLSKTFRQYTALMCCFE